MYHLVAPQVQEYRTSTGSSHRSASFSRLYCLSRPEYVHQGRNMILQLAFHSRSLRTICESEARAKRELEPSVADALQHRLADLRAATSIKDLVVGRPRPLDDGEKQNMVVDLCDSHRLVFCANHPKNPLAESGKLDWQSVSRVKVLRIEKNHA